MAGQGAIKRAAEAARTLWQEFGTGDPEELCAALGISLYARDNFQQLKGMYAVIEGRPCIFYKQDLDEQSRRLVLAHELGHDRLHRDLADKMILIQDRTFLDMSSRPELEANLFAAELLLDDKEFLDLAAEGLSLEQMACRFGYPQGLLYLKAELLKARGVPLQLPEIGRLSLLQES